jgi:endonuclease YncB( thermonuclease family)
MTRRWPLVALLALLTSSPAVAASEYQSKVVRVLDGDTIEVLHNQYPERIRLSGIDCPERWINSTISQFPRLAVSSVPS